MKWMIACASLAVPSLTSACPPTNQHPIAVAEREQAFRDQVHSADGIVYGVVERAITTRKGSTGLLRIFHVYKGAYVSGQRLKMRYAIPPYPCGMAYIPPGHISSVAQGQYGVVLIPALGSSGAAPFRGFIRSDQVALMIREGLIRSARLNK